MFSDTLVPLSTHIRPREETGGALTKKSASWSVEEYFVLVPKRQGHVPYFLRGRRILFGN